jgi:predicted nucleic acid-binding protein
LKRLVLDASVAAKWFFREPYSDLATQLAAAGPQWVVPDLFFAEMASVFRKKVRRGEIDEPDARESMTILLSLHLQERGTRTIVPSALELALRFQCTVYDALYLTLAISENCPVVTADRKFYNMFSRTDLAGHLSWIEEVQ